METGYSELERQIREMLYREVSVLHHNKMFDISAEELEKEDIKLGDIFKILPQMIEYIKDDYRNELIRRIFPDV
jgi:hypothetical protein